MEKNSAILREYVYDGDGKRLQITEGNVTTTYVYSGLNILYEENTTGTAAYIYGPTGLLAKKTVIDQEANTFYYHTDHLGSTRLVTDSDRNIIAAVIYHPFGEPSAEEDSEHYLFTGKEQDATTLYYYGARYYDPEIGRFITRDQQMGGTDNPQSLNRYTYCINNPLKYIDPDGHDHFKPEWGQGRERYYSFYWASIRSQLWQFKFYGQLATEYYNFANEHPNWNWLLVGGASNAGGIVAGAAVSFKSGSVVGVLIWALCGVLYWSADQYFADLWNDNKFVELWDIMEIYLDQLVKGYDCEQEFNDACCDLVVYLLQEQYGDNWREHADPELLEYYDEMQERRDSSSNSS